MKAATLFSGIGAPEQAMPGWDWRWSAEIEKFPKAIMAARHPASINLGDVNAEDFVERAAAIASPDVIVFGSPCQSFSIAGRRVGLDDPRGNLALVALGIIDRLKPGWFVFENVPGLLSSSEGRDFGLFLRAVDELGYSGAWAVLDAQYCGLAQRRERLFFVGSSGDWRNSAAVLFEPESLCWNPPSRRATGETITHELAPCIGESGRGFERAGDTRGQDAVIAWALQERDGKGADSSTKDGHLIVADPIQANEQRSYSNAGNNPRPRNVIPVLEVGCRTGLGDVGRDGIGIGEPGDPMFSLQGSKQHGVFATASAVRRLTPTECERLQGFPDGYTAMTYRGKPAADGPRYRALGNSMAVPVLRWILSRIETMEHLCPTSK